jgi:hypothetical protein
VKSGPKTHAEYRADSVPHIPGARAPVPADLASTAALIWEAIVQRLPADFFTVETLPLLKAYCRHSQYADQYAADISKVRQWLAQLESGDHDLVPGDDEEEADVVARALAQATEHLHTLSKLHGFETDHAATVATKLRITNQSRFVPDKAGSKSRSAPANLPPWVDWGERDDTPSN